MTKRTEIKRVSLLGKQNNDQAVFYEIHTFINVGDTEKWHRNTDITFKSREEAEAWLAMQA